MTLAVVAVALTACAALLSVAVTVRALRKQQKNTSVRVEIDGVIARIDELTADDRRLVLDLLTGSGHATPGPAPTAGPDPTPAVPAGTVRDDPPGDHVDTAERRQRDRLLAEVESAVELLRADAKPSMVRSVLRRALQDPLGPADAGTPEEDPAAGASGGLIRSPAAQKRGGEHLPTDPPPGTAPPVGGRPGPEPAYDPAWSPRPGADDPAHPGARAAGSGVLTARQVALLDRLADGDTVAAAAAAQTISLPVAERQLALARLALGVATTREAVLAYRRHQDELRRSATAGSDGTAEDPQVTIVDAGSASLLQDQLRQVIQTLSDSEVGIAQLRFGLIDGQPRTLDEVAQVYGVTRERIRQIEAKALSRLQPRQKPEKPLLATPTTAASYPRPEQPSPPARYERDNDT